MFLAETEVPTEAPTEAPTESPTEAPTVAPTAAPTETPTEAPTESPPVSSTEAPTEVPTETPTQAPTEGPTQDPTTPEVCFNVSTFTKSWGNEMEWTIGCSDGSCRPCGSIPPEGSSYVGHAEYTQECCLPEDQESFMVTCTDTWGDGWHGGHLEIGGNKYCEQFLTGTEWIESMPNDFVTTEPGLYKYHKPNLIKLMILYHINT